MKTDKNTAAQKSLDEATRYIENAKKELALAKKNGKVYDDIKHLRVACGTAYIGVLKAVDGIFIMRGIVREKKKKVSIEFYEINLAKIDKKMLHSLNVVYQTLHLDGYYNEYNDVRILAIGFEEAESILKKLKQML